VDTSVGLEGCDAFSLEEALISQLAELESGTLGVKKNEQGRCKVLSMKMDESEEYREAFWSAT
jgi:hypothetical protein